MADRGGLAHGARSVALIPALTLAVATLGFVGAGPMNGDAAIYADQARDGAPTDRWTHVGFVAFLMAFGWIGDPAGVADLLSVAGCVAATAAVGLRWGAHAGWMLAGLLLPLAPFGEVDGAWAGLLALGVLLPDARVGAVAIGAAVTVSPTVLAGVPWGLATTLDRRWLAVPAVLLALVGLSGGAWLTGTRGVLTGGWVPHPLEQAPWLLLPILMAAPALAVPGPARTVLPLALFGLLAPADVPGRWIVGLALAPLVADAARTPWGRGIPVLLLLHGLLALRATQVTHRRVISETAVIERVAARLGPRDGVVGPWSWAVRVGLARTGDPDGVPWRTPGTAPPSAAFCRSSRPRVAWLPPGARPAGLPRGEPGPDGVLWTSGEDPSVTIGCW